MNNRKKWPEADFKKMDLTKGGAIENDPISISEASLNKFEDSQKELDDFLIKLRETRITIDQMIQRDKEKKLSLTQNIPDKKDEKKETVPNVGPRLFSASQKNLALASPQLVHKNNNISLAK